MRRALRSPRPGAIAALVLLAALSLPPVRSGLEAGMATHMLVQLPLLGLCGWLLAGAVPAAALVRVQRWNACGITGLLACALVLSLAMIPRLLDLAVADWRMDLAKALALLAGGAALRWSWRRAGLVVQAFFLGNVLPMMGVAGQLYQDSPLRLCNAYLLQEQVRVGHAMVALALLVAAAWIVNLLRVLAWRDAGGVAACETPPASSAPPSAAAPAPRSPRSPPGSTASA